MYVNRYDGPHGTYPERTYAGHCMDLAPAFRMVAYPQMEEYSKKITAAYGAFMRTRDPSTPELKWPKFDLENRAVMVYDKAFSVVSDPLREEREALDRAVGHKKVVDCYTSKNYKVPLNGKC